MYAGQASLYVAACEHLFFHDFARHAPVGIVVEHHPLAAGFGRIQLTLQVFGAADGDEAVFGVLAWGCRGDATGERA
ncbi:hypothetical protein D3C78_1498070 [compost metagenome]